MTADAPPATEADAVPSDDMPPDEGAATAATPAVSGTGPAAVPPTVDAAPAAVDPTGETAPTVSSPTSARPAVALPTAARSSHGPRADGVVPDGPRSSATAAEAKASVTASAETDPIPLPLAALHAELGAQMVPFAGYAMPVRYPAGVMAEHLHTRAHAGLFDVSHMGQVILRGPDRAAALERLIPMDVAGLHEGRQRYGLLTLPSGGVADDLMFANRGDHLLLVVNGAMKHADMAILRAALPDHEVTLLGDRALLALQGPEAARVLDALVPGVAAMRFMDVRTLAWRGADLWIGRSGYTGEDGYEIGVPLTHAEPFARALLADPAVLPTGLGARDSLRIEAGMPLYGQDVTPGTTPAEASLGWAIQKVRRAGGAREGGFPGAHRILPELTRAPARRRTGLLPEGRAPMRAGVTLHATPDGAAIGEVTSGGFGPTLGAPVAMGYVPHDTPPGTVLYGDVRGRRLPVTVTELPFHRPRYVR